MNMPIEKGILVALAWPHTHAYSAGGKWYEYLYKVTGINDNKRYRLGHAGQILIRPKTGLVEYYDFGRYTTAVGRGRTRGIQADPELAVPVKARFNSRGEWLNIEEVFIHIESRGADTHGEGPMLASISYEMDYHKCREFCVSMVEQGSMPYDPFKKKASNCSRFVSDTLKAGALDSTTRLKLKTMVLRTATPTSNLYNGASSRQLIFEVFNGIVKPVKDGRVASAWKFIKNVLAKEAKHSEEEYRRIRETAWWEPNRPNHLPDEAQWLTGMGSGHWFHIETHQGNIYQIARYAFDGRKDFVANFTVASESFDPNAPYTFIHDSTACFCMVEQGDQTFRFDFIEMLECVIVEA